MNSSVSRVCLALCKPQSEQISTAGILSGKHKRLICIALNNLICFQPHAGRAATAGFKADAEMFLITIFFF